MLFALVLSSCGVRSPGGDWSRRWNALGCGRETFWALVAQLAVRPVMVVLAAVVLHDYAGFGQRPELLPVEALVAQASMETLDEAILPRTAGLDIDRLDLVGGQPSLDFLGDKLGTIVTLQVEVSEVLCLGPVYYSSFSSDLPRRGSAPQFPPSRGVMGARSPHSEGISLIC